MNEIEPFAYPLRPHRRRHGPKGYSAYGMYRNWLRDDFTFRCVYCLRRETWATLKKDFQLDHFLPKSVHSDRALDYDNLVYSCASCNHEKAARFVVDPCKKALGKCVRVKPDGTIEWLNEDGENLVEALGLDDEDYNDFRAEILQLLNDLPTDSVSFRTWFGFPINRLPDLSKEPEPPGGNSRPRGISRSYFQLKDRGELPEYY